MSPPARSTAWARGVRLAAWAWTAAMAVAASIPGVPMPDPPLLSASTLQHVAGFAVWAALWRRALPGDGAAVSVWGLAFGVWIEVWQGTMPLGRTADPLDVVADAVGLALGVAVSRGVDRAWARRAPSGAPAR